MKKLSILLVALLTSLSAMSQFPARLGPIGAGGAGAGAGAGAGGAAGAAGGAASSALFSGPQTFAQEGTFQIGGTSVKGSVTKLPDGSLKVTTGGNTMTLSPTADPGTFTVTQSTVPGVVAGAGTTVKVTSGTLTGVVNYAGGAWFAGPAVAATVAAAAFVAVVSTTQQNRGSTSGSTSN